MNENSTTYAGDVVVSICILLAAAAIGYLADYFFMLVLKSDGLAEALNALVVVLPLISTVIFIQEFAFKVRRGQVLLFHNQAIWQAVANGLFILCFAALLGLIAQRTIILGGKVHPSITSYIVLMAASYACNGVIRFFRKHPLG